MFGNSLPSDYFLFPRLDREATGCSTYNVISTASLLIRYAAEQELNSDATPGARKEKLIALLRAIDALFNRAKRPMHYIVYANNPIQTAEL